LNLPLHIAKRYFFSKKRGGGSLNLISVVSGISLLGYIVGAASLVIILSVFNGFEALFTSMYKDFDSDLRITADAGKSIDSASFNWEAFNSVLQGEPYSLILEENVLLRYDERQSIATLKGVDNNYASVTGFDKTVVSGQADIRNEAVFAVVGQGIAYQLSLDPNDVFKALAIYVPKREIQSTLNPEDAFNKALVIPSGVFSAQEEADNKYVVCAIGFARELLQRKGQFTAIEINVTDDGQIDNTQQKLQTLLGNDYKIKNRFEQHDAFFKVMKSEKVVSYFILLFILFIAASNTISSLYILAMEKKRDILVLKSMGITKRDAARVFVYEGLIIAIVGGGVGVLLGLILSLLQQHYGFIALQESTDVVFSSYPIKVEWIDLLLVMGTVLILGYLTTLYPSKKVKQLMVD
jgi:lipoprotein-releasing system permease protein